MNQYFSNWLPMFATMLLTLALAGCHVETTAFGTVKDAQTGLPIAGAHVMEVAITPKTEQLLCEAYTDSAGSFSMDAGDQGFGLRSVKLMVIVEKANYKTGIAENRGVSLNMLIRHY